MQFKEAIIVEGRDDVVAVKRAVHAEVIPVHGFGVRRPQTLELIQKAHQRVGVIVFTDPDTAGKHIRRIINEHIEGAKHAYIERKEGTHSNGNVGVENASPEVIQHALLQARPEYTLYTETFNPRDLIYYDLTGHSTAGQRRQRLGTLLGIGHTNGKQLIQRLNRFGITREEVENALIQMDEEELTQNDMPMR